MSVATLDEIAGIHKMTIPSNNANSGGSPYLGVHRLDRIVATVASGVNHGWYRNSTGSDQSVRLQMSFPYPGYSITAWFYVSSVAPDALVVVPVASASSVTGVQQLTIASNTSASGNITVPAGQYLYIVAIEPNLNWAGSSSQMLELHLADGTFLNYIIFFPSFHGAGATFERWDSPVFITTGTNDAPSARWYGNWAAVYVPANYYVYVVQIDVNITWGGGSTQDLYLHDGATGIVATLATWPSWFGVSPGTTIDSWKSPFFLNGGTTTPPSMPSHWSLNGGQKGVFRQDVPSGYYQNGGTARTMYIANDFAYPGYAMNVDLVVDGAAPSSMVPPGIRILTPQPVVIS